MNMATIVVSGVYAHARMYSTIPAGIVGATVAFEFTDPIWEELTKTAVFQGAETRDVILTGNTAVIPAETVATAGPMLKVGIYGVDAENNLVIPTLWAVIGGIRDAADPSGDPGTDPELPIWAQLADRVEGIAKDVEELQQTGGAGPGTPGAPDADGEDGGYYTPAVTQLDEDTIQFAFTPSKEDMPAVNPVTVELPVGQGSGGNVDYVLPVGGAELGGVKNGGNVVINSDGTMTAPVSGDSNIVSQNNIYTFLDAYTAWCNGEKFPVAFYGDSTFYGVNTSGAGYTFCDHLQTMLREECGQYATVYRVAKAGATLDTAINEFDSYFGDTGAYADTKMLGIGHGINDRLSCKTYEQYKSTVRTKLETLIQKCFARSIQPFLVTSQATIECGVATNYIGNSPLRDANSINVCANGVKKELANKYGIPVVDFNRATELYLLNSTQPVDAIISDRLHFGDVGHAFEAGFMFSQIVSRTVNINGKDKTVLSYANQNLRNAIPEDKISYGGLLKLSANYTKDNSEDVKIFDAYVYVCDYPAQIWAYRNTASSASYVKIDGVSMNLSAIESDLGMIDVGLHHLEAFSGASDTVDFAGFVVNKSVSSTDTEDAVMVESITLNYTDKTVNVGEKIQLTATVFPDNATYKQVSWIADNDKCTVTSGGLVTAVSPGNCTLTAVAIDGSEKTASCEITIVDGDVIFDSTNIEATETKFLGMNNNVVPVALIFGMYETESTDSTKLSGKKIDSITLNLTAGQITIGKVDMLQFGSGDMTMLSPTKYTVEGNGFTTINLGGLELGETETLAIGKVGDTAYPYFVNYFATVAPGSDAYILPAREFREGSTSPIGMKCKITGS